MRDNLLAVEVSGPKPPMSLLYVYERPYLFGIHMPAEMLSAAGYILPKGYENSRRLAAAGWQARFTTAEQQRFHGLIVEAGKQATAAGGWETYWQWLMQHCEKTER